LSGGIWTAPKWDLEEGQTLPRPRYRSSSNALLAQPGSFKSFRVAEPVAARDGSDSEPAACLEETDVQDRVGLPVTAADAPLALSLPVARTRGR
jgi:hypothetical protein